MPSSRTRPTQAPARFRRPWLDLDPGAPLANDLAFGADDLVNHDVTLLGTGYATAIVFDADNLCLFGSVDRWLSPGSLQLFEAVEPLGSYAVGRLAGMGESKPVAAGDQALLVWEAFAAGIVGGG